MTNKGKENAHSNQVIQRTEQSQTNVDFIHPESSCRTLTDLLSFSNSFIFITDYKLCSRKRVHASSKWKFNNSYLEKKKHSSRFLWNLMPGWPLFQQAAGIRRISNKHSEMLFGILTLAVTLWTFKHKEQTDLYLKAMPSSHCCISWEIHISAEGRSSEHKLVTSTQRQHSAWQGRMAPFTALRNSF